jgi:hypothetical protein
MDKLSHIYILIFPALNLIKVGKADNVINRVQTLERIWGNIDYAASFKLIIPAEKVFSLERTLHFFLQQYHIETEDCRDGYTEVFSMDALSPVLRHIDYLITEGIIPATLSQGIEQKEICRVARRKKSTYASVIHTVEKLSETINSNHEKFEKINRLLILLLKGKNKWQYQYEFDNGIIVFRFIYDYNLIPLDTHRLIRLFSFDFYDFQRMGGINCCSEIRTSGNIVQCVIRTLSEEQDKYPFLNYLFSQSLFLLNKLPMRSPLLVEDLPLLGTGE